MKDKLACKSILYLFSDDLTGKNAKENAIENEKERGLQVKGYIMVPTSTTDFYPFLTNALRSNPDYIHCKTPVGSIALVVKQARELGYKGYITSPTSMPGDLEKWQGIAGVEASKGFIGIMASPEEYTSLGLEYNALWEQICPKIKSTDLAYSVHAHILMMAIEKAQSFDPDDILKVLRTAEFHSFHKLPLKASGEKTFGIKNHMTVPVPYSTVVGKGQIKYLGSAQMFTP
jgi:ABC-type branched-subunit amino acid transport system substrate-binding protein